MDPDLQRTPRLAPAGESLGGKRRTERCNMMTLRSAPRYFRSWRSHNSLMTAPIVARAAASLMMFLNGNPRPVIRATDECPLNRFGATETLVGCYSGAILQTL